MKKASNKQKAAFVVVLLVAATLIVITIKAYFFTDTEESLSAANTQQEETAEINELQENPDEAEATPPAEEDEQSSFTGHSWESAVTPDDSPDIEGEAYASYWFDEPVYGQSLCYLSYIDQKTNSIFFQKAFQYKLNDSGTKLGLATVGSSSYDWFSFSYTGDNTFTLADKEYIINTERTKESLFEIGSEE
jgi:hypothetical protein